MSKHNSNTKFATTIDGTPVIERHTAAARVNHWIVAIFFICCTISGLALFHPAMSWMRELFGGGTWNRILHPFFGVIMFVSFLGLAARYWSHNTFTKLDVQWMKQIADVVGGREDKLPPIGMYNAGQKVLFWTLSLLMLALGVTGIAIWQEYFTFSADIKRIAVLLHALCAFGLICFIIVHVLAAILAKGSINAMVRGTVSYGWAKHNHSLWYKEIVDAETAMAKK